MAFLRNDAINRVNLHTTIQAFAQGAGGLFFLVVLLESGVSVTAALLALAAVHAGRFVLRPLLLPLARRFGLRPLLVFGALVLALPYLLLAEVDGVGAAFYVFIALLAFGDIFYWVSYNAYFSALGDAEHRGHQVGIRESMVSVVNIVAPLVGAWGLVAAGPHWLFAGVALVQVLSVLPLLGAPNVAVRAEAPGVLRAARLGVLLNAADAWFDSGFIFVWQIALFISLDRNIAAYGGAMALAGLVGAGGSLLLGRHVDLGHGRRSVVIAYAIGMAVVALRAASFGSPWLAVGANALGALVLPLIIPVASSPVHNLAKASACTFRFHLAAEGGWDIGCVTGCLIAAAIAASGASLAWGIAMSIPVMACAAFVLWRYYAPVRLAVA